MLAGDGGRGGQEDRVEDWLAQLRQLAGEATAKEGRTATSEPATIEVDRVKAMVQTLAEVVGAVLLADLLGRSAS